MINDPRLLHTTSIATFFDLETKILLQVALPLSSLWFHPPCQCLWPPSIVRKLESTSDTMTEYDSTFWISSSQQQKLLQIAAPLSLCSMVHSSLQGNAKCMVPCMHLHDASHHHNLLGIYLEPFWISLQLYLKKSIHSSSSFQRSQHPHHCHQHDRINSSATWCWLLCLYCQTVSPHQICSSFPCLAK